MIVYDSRVSQQLARRPPPPQPRRQARTASPSLSSTQFRGLMAAQTKLNALGFSEYDFDDQLRRPPPPPRPVTYNQMRGFGDFGETWVGKTVLWGNKWWEVDGVPCGFIPGIRTEPLPRADCEERLNWCKQYHPNIVMQCFRECGALNTHPRTEEGRGCRHLPNLPGQSTTIISGAASAIGTVASVIAPPDLDELDPVTLCRILLTNPARYYAIMTWASVGLAVTLPIVTAQAIAKGRDLRQVLESIGGVLIAPVIPAVIALGMTQAVKRGGWDYAWEQIAGPALDIAGDVANAVIAFFTGGPVAAFAAGMRFIAKRISDVFISSVMMAISDTIGVVVQAINGGIEFLKQSTLYVAIGNALSKIGKALSATAGVVRDVIITAGTALATFATMISMLLQGDFNGAKNEAVKQTLGVDLATLDKTTSADRQRLIVPNQPIISAMNSVVSIVTAIVDALARAAKFLAVSPLVDFLNSLSGSIGGFVKGVLSFVGSIVPTPGPPPPSAEELARTLAARDQTIAQLQAQLAKESQGRVAAESALVAKAQEASVLAQKFATANAAAQAGAAQVADLSAQAEALQKQQAEAAQAGGGTGLAIAAAAAAAFLAT